MSDVICALCNEPSAAHDDHHHRFVVKRDEDGHFTLKGEGECAVSRDGMHLVVGTGLLWITYHQDYPGQYSYQKLIVNNGQSAKDVLADMLMTGGI